MGTRPRLKSRGNIPGFGELSCRVRISVGVTGYIWGYRYTGVDRSFFDYLQGAGDVFNRTKYIIRAHQMPAIITIHPSRTRTARSPRPFIGLKDPFHCVAAHTRPVDSRNYSVADDDKPR